MRATSLSLSLSLSHTHASYLDGYQCDQISRNFATLVKSNMSLETF